MHIEVQRQTGVKVGVGSGVEICIRVIIGA